MYHTRTCLSFSLFLSCCWYMLDPLFDSSVLSSTAHVHNITTTAATHIFIIAMFAFVIFILFSSPAFLYSVRTKPSSRLSWLKNRTALTSFSSLSVLLPKRLNKYITTTTTQRIRAAKFCWELHLLSSSDPEL